jgi:drug/metabolite transporter (DMT)-like permease
MEVRHSSILICLRHFSVLSTPQEQQSPGVSSIILQSVTPFALLLVDALITAILCVPFAGLQRGGLVSLLQVSRKKWMLIVGSLICAAVANLVIYASIRVLGASTASTVEITYPFFVVVFSFLAFNSSPSPMFLVGALLIFMGATVIIMFGLS